MPATPFAALRSASRIARRDSSLARLEYEKTGHGACELARQIKAACPDISLAACRRAADQVLAVRLEQVEHTVGNGVSLGNRGMLRSASSDCRGPWSLVRQTPSRALGRTPEAVPPLAERLIAHKAAKLTKAFDATGFRHSRAWSGDFRVAFGTPATASQTTETGWIDYKRQGHRQGITGETVRLTVPADWGTRIKPLDTTSGLLLLDAQAVPTDGDLAVYAATWCRQGRGVSLVVERGFLAVHVPSGTQYHATGSDAMAAVRGLSRQVRAQGVPAADRARQRTEAAERRRQTRETKLARLLGQLARHDLSEIGHVEVTLADSYRAGNCEPGTLSFRDRVLPGRESATISEIAAAVGVVDPAGLAGEDLTLARQLAAACLAAIRRHRNGRRLVAV